MQLLATGTPGAAPGYLSASPNSYFSDHHNRGFLSDAETLLSAAPQKISPSEGKGDKYSEAVLPPGRTVWLGALAFSAVAKAAGWSLTSNVARGVAVASGVDLKSTSAPGQALEGASRIGVAVAAVTAQIALANIATDLELGSALIGAALFGPPGAVVFGAMGMIAPFVSSPAVSLAGNYAITEAVILGQHALEGASNSIAHGYSSLENAILSSYHTQQF
jgi:hypothetical protein